MTAKRPYGAGSLTEDPNRPGVFRLRWRTGVDPYTGKAHQHQETFRGPRKAAQKRLAEHIARAKPSSALTVGQLVDHHLDHAELLDDTRAIYRAAARTIPTGFLDLRADAVTPPAVATLYRHLTAGDLGPHQVHRIAALLSGAYRHGIEAALVATNPVRGVRKPSIPRRQYRLPTPDELAALFAAADRERQPSVGIWMRLAAGSGARRVELLELRWADVNLAAGTITVRTAKKRDMRTRTIPLDPDTASRLRRWHTQAAERALTVGRPLGPGAFVLSDVPDSSEPWRLALASRRFRRIADHLGLDGVRLHDIRHQHITWLLEHGVSKRTAADRAGHASPIITQTIYGHLLDGADQHAAQVVGRLVAPTEAPTRRRVVISRGSRSSPSAP